MPLFFIYVYKVTISLTYSIKAYPYHFYYFMNLEQLDSVIGKYNNENTFFGVNNEITCFGNGINCWLSAFSGLAKADKLDDIKQAGVVRIAILIVTHRLVLSIHKPKNWQVMMQILRMKLPKIRGKIGITSN